VVAGYLLTLVVAVAIGVGLRDASLARVSSYYTERAAVLSPALLASDELRQAYELAIANDRVRDRLEISSEKAGGESRWLVYVVPESWHLPDLPLESWREIPAEHRGGHTTPRDFERGLYKILFTRVRSHRPKARAREIATTAYGREPVVRVRLDLRDAAVTAVESPPASVVWGDIPTPLY